MTYVDLNIYSMACYTFILTSVVCAVVRWFHVCKPYAEDADYYFPIRRMYSFFSAATVLLIPYVLRPMDADTWYFARTFGILYYPLFFSAVFNKFFYGRGVLHGWMQRTYFFVVMSILVVMMMTALLVRPAVMEYEQVWINSITGAISLLLSSYYVWMSCRIVRTVDAYHEQNYSDVNDFPYAFLKRVVLIPLLWMVVEWMVFISASRDMKAVVDVAFSVFNIVYLMFCLSPHILKTEYDSGTEGRTQNSEAVEIMEETEKEEETMADVNEEIRQEVLATIARRFKEPGLKRVQVIADVSYRKKKQAGEFITSVGFYKLVNTFRLYYLKDFAEAHPEMSMEGIAMSCGFKDRFALNNARKRIAEIDMNLIRTGMEGD